MVTSIKGGVGKTTVSANLAMAIARLGYSTVAVDCDLESRCLDMVFGLEDDALFNLCDVLAGSCSLDHALVKDTRCETLSFLPAPSLFSFDDGLTSRIVSRESVKALIDGLSERFEFIILDLPARPDALYQQIATHANYALILSMHTAVSIRAAEKTAVALEEMSEKAMAHHAANSDRAYSCAASLAGLDDPDDAKRLKCRLIINCFLPKDVKKGIRPGLYDIITQTHVKLFGAIPYDSEMAKAQEKGLLAEEVASGKTPFQAAIHNIAKRCAGCRVPLFDGVALSVKKQDLY